MHIAARKGNLGAGLGLALTPQAGVAMGMALLAGERFPEFGSTLMAVVVVSTVAFEAVGPWLVRVTLARADKGNNDNKTEI